MDQTYINSLFEEFNKKRVLVIGDVMIDAYFWGKVDRISPEAPVPVVSVQSRENRLGGAANVALNIKALGTTPILATVIGADHYGTEFNQLLVNQQLNNKGISPSTERPTTVKTRIISGDQQMMRVDEETTRLLSGEEEKSLLNRIANILENDQIDVVIFEDYNKGVLTTNVISTTIKWATQRGIPTAVDPKKTNFFSYKGVTLFKPNLKELKEGLKQDISTKNPDELIAAVKLLKQKVPHKTSLITLSEMGVYVNDGEDNFIPAHLRNISDVSGAGDSVISVAALCLACACSPYHMASLANLAGGLVCEKVGVVPIDKNLLLQEALKLYK